MAAEIVDLGKYRKQKERGQKHAQELKDSPPPKETEDDDGPNHGDETA